MKRSMQQGFTLIELMIVVAIIGILAASAAKVGVQDILASGNPQADASGYETGFTTPNATRNVAGIAIAPATGIITITTTPAAGNGTIILTPNAPVGTALPAANGTAFTPPSQAVAWRCAVTGASVTAFAGAGVGTLPARFAPSECK